MAKKETNGEKKDDETIYDEQGREELVNDDELSPEEEAFMRGYDEAEDEEGKDDKEKDEDAEEEFSDEE